MKIQKTFFIIASLNALLTPLLLPVPLTAYAPYLMYVLMNRSIKETLWHTLLCGLIMDLLQSTFPFGYCALCYTLIALILYRQKWWFFNDKIGSLALFVSIFSFLLSVLQLISLNFEAHTLSLCWSIFLSDFVLMPLYDGLYALICFTVPTLLYHEIKKRGFRFLFIRNLN
jgi:cell shape-determining protein MreD